MVGNFPEDSHYHGGQCPLAASADADPYLNERVVWHSASSSCSALAHRAADLFLPPLELMCRWPVVTRTVHSS